jgi:hypothetical protein
MDSHLGLGTAVSPRESKNVKGWTLKKQSTSSKYFQPRLSSGLWQEASNGNFSYLCCRGSASVFNDILPASIARQNEISLGAIPWRPGETSKTEMPIKIAFVGPANRLGAQYVVPVNCFG